MEAHQTSPAPWCRLLKMATGLAFVVCLGIVGIGLTVFPHTKPIERWTVILVPLSVLVCGAPFMVRGYSVADGVLIIHRLGWESRLPLDSLVSATPDPEAMKNSLRTFGNGGLFAFCGMFRNHKLGNYRAFATDPAKAVVLKFKDHIVVVTPDAPDKFAAEINGHNHASG
jgi:hypothetical protein